MNGNPWKTAFYALLAINIVGLLAMYEALFR